MRLLHILKISFLILAISCSSSPTQFIYRNPASASVTCKTMINSIIQEQKLTPQKLKKILDKVDSEVTLTQKETEHMLDQFARSMHELAVDQKEYKSLKLISKEMLSSEQSKRIKILDDKFMLSIPDEKLNSLLSDVEVSELGLALRNSDIALNDIEKFLKYSKLPKDRLSVRAINLLKKEAFTISPLILIPLASIVFDGGITAAILAGIKLSAGIKGMDIALDKILDNTAKFLSKKHQAFVLAASGNLPEAGSSFLPAMSGRVSMADAGSVPLGSNPANFILAGVALVSATKNIAKAKGILKRGKSFTPALFVKTLRSIDYKAMKKDAGYAAYFVANALLFRYFVKPQMHMGNNLPLIGWLTVNIPSLIYYFTKDLIKSRKIYTGAIKEFNIEELKRITRLSAINRTQFGDSANKMDSILSNLSDMKKKSGKLSPNDIKKSLKDLKKAMKSDQNYRNEIERNLHNLDSKELTALLKFAGIDFKTASTMTKKEIVTSVSAIILGIGGIIMLSGLLDSGVNDITEAFPEMGKSTAGFFILSFFSSLPELMGTQKLFSRLDFSGGMQNIADSNALNLMLAKMAMAMAYFRHQENPSEILIDDSLIVDEPVEEAPAVIED